MPPPHADQVPLAALEPPRLQVSVVIPVFNRSAELADCLSGLGAQSLARELFEVVVVDNCSTEDLGPVADVLRARFGLNLRLARTLENKGPAPARNLGVSLASAPLIAFTDSDCRPHPQWLEAGLQVMADPAIEFATGPVRAKPEQPVRFTSRVTFENLQEHPSYPTANLFVRRAVFLHHGGFDQSLSFRDPLDRTVECADTDFAWRVLEAGGQHRFAADASVWHEVEQQDLLRWMLDPTRIFLLPELVRRHPGLRGRLLSGGLFFYPRAWLVPAGLVMLLVLALGAPAWLIAAPVLLLARAAQRLRTLNPVALLWFCARACLNALRLCLMLAALLYGSLRFRSLVL